MRHSSRWLWVAIAISSLAGPTASACHVCKHTPCVVEPPAPAYECVTEMVPVTVMKTRTKVDLVPAYTRTVNQTKIDIEYDIQVATVSKPVFDTIFLSRCVTVCRPVCETKLVCRSYTVCRPVTTTRQVTEYCTKAYTELITVPVKARCGRCGHHGGGCTCITVARTCHKRVPVVREVAETRMVSEVRTEMVPVTCWKMVPEQRIEQYPVTTCRMVPDVVRVKVPRMVIRCVPRTLVYKRAVLTCQEIPVTIYKPVVRMVPVIAPTPQVLPEPQAVTVPSGQADAAAGSGDLKLAGTGGRQSEKSVTPTIVPASATNPPGNADLVPARGGSPN